MRACGQDVIPRLPCRYCIAHLFAVQDSFALGGLAVWGWPALRPAATPGSRFQGGSSYLFKCFYSELLVNKRYLEMLELC